MSDTPKRIAFFIPSMRAGGAERVTLTLSREIAARGYTVDLLLAQLEGPQLNDIPKTVRLVNLKANRVLYSLPALVLYLRRERPHTILSMMAHTNLVTLWACRLSGVSTRTIVSERNSVSGRIQHRLNMYNKVLPWLIRRFYPWADGIIAVSKGVADDLSQVADIPRESIHVIYNPVVRPELQEKIKAPVDDSWFKPGSPPVLLAAGSLTRQKDFPTLLQAFARVRESQQIRLMILGEGEDRPALEALIKKLGVEKDVCLRGYTQNPYAYMTRAEIFILSSRWEGLPGVLIEALYCGAPLIATDCPSGPREILKDGQYGKLVPIGDVTALAEAIETVLSGTPPPVSRDSWQPFEMDTVVNQYLNVLVEH